MLLSPCFVGTASAFPFHTLSFLTVNINPGAIDPAKQVTVACTGSCQCLKEADAAAVMGGSYEKCAAVPCEYDAAGIAKFCFRAKVSLPTTTITTAAIQVPVVQYIKSVVPTTPAPVPVQPSLLGNVPAVVAASCPANCSPMTEQVAKERFGTFERCSDTPKGYDDTGSLNYCIRAVPVEGPINKTFQSSLISSAVHTAAAGNASSNKSSSNLVISPKLWSSLDALAALRIAVGGAPYSADYDITGDGKVNSADAREILKRSVAGTSQKVAAT